MWETILNLSTMTAGLVPLMVVLFTLAFAVIIERLYFFHKVLSQGEAMERELKRARRADADELRKVQGAYAGALQAGLVATALECDSGDAQEMERHIDEVILELAPTMDQHLWVLDTAVTLGPLMGLLGTILGMIKTFNVLGSHGVGGGAQAVTGGIGEALVATGLGLFIAITGLIFLNYFNKRVRLGLHQMELIKLTLVNRLHANPRAQP